MMQLHDLDIKHLQDIPGYKAILKAVLKSQIQILVEQLADHTGEESILLTASVADGTLCHLGSGTGKHFIDGRDEIKSQFLSFCLKRQDKRTQPEAPMQQGTANRNMAGPRPRHPMGPQQRPFQHQRAHPISHARAPGGGRFRPDFNKRAYPSGAQQDETLIPSKQMKLPTETFPNPYADVRSPQMSQQHRSPSHSLQRSDSETSHSHISVQQIDLSEEARKVKQEPALSSDGDNDPELSNLSAAHGPATPGRGQGEPKDNVQFDTSQVDTSQSLDPDLSNLVSSIPSVTESNNSSDGQSVVKIEPVTEGELELEITGVEMAADADNNSWMPSVSSGQGFPGANTSGSDLDMSGAGQSGMSQKYPVDRRAKQNDVCFGYEGQGKLLKDRRPGIKRSVPVFQCEFCHKAFRYRSLWLEHRRTHTGERPFKCTYCEKSFRTNSARYNHHTYQHGVSNMQCSLCYLKFYSRDKLNKHFHEAHDRSQYRN